MASKKSFPPRGKGRGAASGHWGTFIGAPQPSKLLLTLLLVIPCSGGDGDLSLPSNRRIPQLRVTPGGRIRGGSSEESETEEIQENEEGWGQEKHI